MVFEQQLEVISGYKTLLDDYKTRNETLLKNNTMLGSMSTKYANHATELLQLCDVVGRTLQQVDEAYTEKEIYSSKQISELITYIRKRIEKITVDIK